MRRIQVLPDILINQIAAGEVIERPASVVKELIENALDAGARALSIEIEGGGRRRIRVADDGEGLDRDDATVAFQRHATSKLAVGADLTRIATLGFRGEALPAIASVSRLTMTTSPDGRSGTRVELEAGKIVRVSDAGHPRGTTVEVRDLFFNTPARSKFLRAHATELGHISDLVASYAVAAPTVRIALTHEGRRLLEVTEAAGEAERIRQAFGEEWDQSIPLRASRGPLAVRGWIGRPAAATASRRMQRLYVNGRLVKDRLIAHAITSACEAFLPRGRHAPLFLFVSCPAETVDVNVHPAKAEVRFADSRAVHDLVQTALLESLRSAMPVTPLTGDSGQSGWAVPEPSGRREGPDAAVHEAVLGYMASAQPDRRWTPAGREAGPVGAAVALESEIEDATEAIALAQYRDSYIIGADREGLLVVDQHAAHERILFERMMGRAPDAGQRQALLFPLTLSPPRAMAPRLEEAIRGLDDLGFTVEPFGDGTLLVSEIPALLAGGDPARAIADLLDQMAADDAAGDPAISRRREKLVATVACHAAVKVRMPLTIERMNYLINELFRTSAPLRCPHGRPAVLRFTLRDLERGFGRA